MNIQEMNARLRHNQFLIPSDVSGMIQVHGICTITKRQYHITVPVLGLTKWLEIQHIQDALPDIPKEEREFLLTSMTPAGWDKVFHPRMFIARYVRGRLPGVGTQIIITGLNENDAFYNDTDIIGRKFTVIENNRLKSTDKNDLRYNYPIRLRYTKDFVCKVMKKYNYE